jgi:DNA-binding CsgD family transcriptional regulator
MVRLRKKGDFVEEIIDDVASEQKERMEVPPDGPGILLLTASMQLLYKDRRAGDLCRQIIRSQDGKRAHGVLPPAVVTLVDQIRTLLTVQTNPKDWEQIQLRHVVNTLHNTVVLCGTAFMDQTNAEARILIVLSEVGIVAWQDQVIFQAKKEFHLTVRETTVVQYLFKGWTNKQIANEMNLADQTIKEHFRHISEKMSTTNRTEMVMKLIHSGLQHYAQTTPPPQVIVHPMRGRPIELVGVA